MGEVEVFRPEPMETLASVEIRGIRDGLVVHPGEVVVLTFPQGTPEDYLIQVRYILLDAGLRPDQFVLLAGVKASSRPAVPEVEESSSRQRFRPGWTDEDGTDVPAIGLGG